MINEHVKNHLAENEMVFRGYNEKVQQGFDELNRLATQEGKGDLSFSHDEPLLFYCECSDENCDKRIMLKPSTYAQIHERRDRFVVIEGHDLPEIERVIRRMPGYSVIEKLSDLPDTIPSLHSTDANNA